MGGGDGGGTPPTVGGSNIGPYTQSIVNHMTPQATQPAQVQLQQAYDKIFGGLQQPSFQSMANANSLKMIDSLPLQNGMFSVLPNQPVSVLPNQPVSSVKQINTGKGRENIGRQSNYD